MDDNQLSPMLCTRESQACFSTSKRNLTCVTINAGKIATKHYYIAGNQPIPEWLTTPTLAHDKWTNPDVEYLINGHGDIFIIQEAEGFEDDGPIAKRLAAHGMKTAYFQKGSAPPLAIVAKGPCAEDIRYYGDEAERLSGQRPRPEDEISIVILACDTIPWGGVKDFCNQTIPHDNLRRHQREAPPSPDDGSPSKEDEPSERTPDGEDAQDPQAKQPWAGTYMTALISFGCVTLHQEEHQWHVHQQCHTAKVENQMRYQWHIHQHLWASS